MTGSDRNRTEEKGIEHLRRTYKREIADNARTRQLQQVVDKQADDVIASIKAEPDKLDWAINQSVAFCHFSKLSKHHKSDEFLDYASRAFGEWADGRIKQPVSVAGLSHETAWRICSMVPTYIWLSEDFDAELNARVMQAFARDAEAFRARKSSGQVGNQEMANCEADLLYAYLLDDADYLAASIAEGDAALFRTLNEDGQVIEQYAPCPHYSYLAIAFAFEYVMLRPCKEFDDRLRKSLDWFLKYHTESLYLIPGPSSRKYHLREMTRPSDLYGPLEYFASDQPMYRKQLDRMSALSEGSQIWQIFANKSADYEPTEADIEDWHKPFSAFYEHVYYGRGPVKYALVTRKYQTGITFTGWLPLMGLQTWAWGDEPPILHPVHDVPSGTQAWGIDTARFPCSHLYYKNGPGCMAADVAWRGDGSSRENLPDEPAFVVLRNHTLRSVVIFTDVSTVVILTGPTGKRVTRWTLNAVEAADPIVAEDGTVYFENRAGRIYSVHCPPKVLEEKAEVAVKAFREQQEVTVRSLSYESDGGPSVFAFSNDSFSVLNDDLENNCILEFKDDAGTYRADISTIVDERGDLTYGLDTAKIKQVG